MNNDKNAVDESGDKNISDQENKNESTQPLPFHNPLKPNDHKQITQEDIDNEQKYKEALSERD